MLPVILLVQVLLLIAVVLLLLRKTAPPAAQDPRQLQLPDQVARLDDYARESFRQMRQDVPDEGARNRLENATAAAALRSEVISNIDTLGNTLGNKLAKFGEENTGAGERLRCDVEQKMRSISQSFAEFKDETTLKHGALQETLNCKLVELMSSNSAHQDKLRAAVEERLNKLNEDNSKELEKMRQTVDEKLQETLVNRLTESFGQVTTHLGEVQKGLGEMKELATGVGDLKKVFANVSLRGGAGQFLVEQQLKQMFSPEQWGRQINIKPYTSEAVDYVLKFPNGEPGSFLLLPIDAKFPTSDLERLEYAYDHGTPEEIATASKGFERAIRTAAKQISDKYIYPPTTMPHAIMVVPTEGLYAEVVRRPGLQADIQNQLRVTIAGPSTFMAILTSFQMGFHTLEIQKKGDDVWKVLAKAKHEFGNFSVLMDKVERQVGTVQNTLRDISGKTTTINRALREVSDTPPTQLELEEISNGSLRLVAGGEE